MRFYRIYTLSFLNRLNERLWGLFIELLKLIDTVFIEIDEDLLLERMINNAIEKLSITLSPENERIAEQKETRKWKL